MKLATLMEGETYQDEEGFVRFKSNDQIPFPDYLEANHPDVDIESHKAKRDEESSAMIQKWIADEEKWRKENPEGAAEADAERDFEMRAAFGPGEDVVNVVTGKRYRT